MLILHQIHQLDQPSSLGDYVLLHTFLLLHDNQVVLGEMLCFGSINSLGLFWWYWFCV